MRASEADSKAWKRPAPAAKKPRKKHTDHEEQEQIILMRWLKAVHPECFAHTFHVPNGGARHIATAAKLKAAGVKAGVSDLLCVLPCGGHNGLAIEFKATPPKSAAVSDSQKEWLARFQSCGWRAELCKGINEAKAVIEDYLAS